MHSAGVIARVLLDSTLPQLDRLMDYRIPEELSSLAIPGVRVKVPLRTAGRAASGYIIERVDETEYSGHLSEISEVVSAALVLTAEVWNLTRRAADRAAGSANDILRLAIPPRQVRIEKAWLENHPRNGAVPASVIPQYSVTGYAPGRIESAIEQSERLALNAIPKLTQLPNDEWVGSWARTMAQAAVHCVGHGADALLVVPDYRDQEQLAAALASLVPSEILVPMDAKQSIAHRYRNFLRCLESGPRIIYGNRSTVYAPSKRLGLIAVWDDGDPLHGEPLSPYVHSRDAALIRQEQQNCALMFLSHTRSVEVQRLVEVGWLHTVSPQPTVTPRMVATALQADGERANARIPSTAWRAATHALESGPVLVQVAQPGYVPVVACQTCREAARCNSCGGILGVPHSGALPQCRVCGALAAQWVCPTCQGTRMRIVSRGTGRTAEELGRAFPGVRVIVSDGETSQLAVSAAPSLVVATRGAEPIASGGYRAVLLLDGERMLGRESLRVGEDCLRWWSNAAALAAPSAPVFLVGVGGKLAQTLATWRHENYALSELVDRRALKFPPAVRIASVQGHPEKVAEAMKSIEAVGHIDVLGPVSIDDNRVRSTVRFEYSQGAAVASALRGEIVRSSTSRRQTPRRGDRFTSAPTLKVRFDNPELL